MTTQIKVRLLFKHESSWVNLNKKTAVETRKPKTDVRRLLSLNASLVCHCSIPSGLAGIPASQKFQGLRSCLPSCPTLMCDVFTFKQRLLSLTGFKNRQIF